jgi:hypothetical protein
MYSMWLPLLLFLGSSAGTVLSEDSALIKATHSLVSVKYSYGNIFMLPSLSSNSYLKVDQTKTYSTLDLRWESNITAIIKYSGQLELTDKPHYLIGTKFSRPDFLLSTGRFQESKVEYNSKHLLIRVGRADFWQENPRPEIFRPPINGDGFSWEFNRNGIAFKHVLESLPAESSSGNIFRRLLAYHHLEYTFGGISVGAGEYFILTGENLGLEFKRLNPFLPFSLNSHDSEQETYPGFPGDTDNSIINFFFNWSSNRTVVNFRIYIDEFQMDPKDRVSNSDAILFTASGKKMINSIFGLNKPGLVSGSISVANPNFGDHPGPFTSATSAGFPLFEYSSGMESMIFLRAEIYPSLKDLVRVSFHSERWLAITSITPEDRNQKSALNRLPIQDDYRVLLNYERNIALLRANLFIEGWISSNPGLSGMHTGIRLDHLF